MMDPNWTITFDIPCKEHIALAMVSGVLASRPEFTARSSFCFIMEL